MFDSNEIANARFSSYARRPFFDISCEGELFWITFPFFSIIVIVIVFIQLEFINILLSKLKIKFT